MCCRTSIRSFSVVQGLGTSKAEEAREYFRTLGTSQVKYTVPDSDKCTQSMRLAFDKKLADDRKRWLLAYEPSVILELSQKAVPVSEFVDKELIHFSNFDNHRSIPSAIDGLKPSQRKVLFGCLKKNIKSDMKVSQLSGAVAEVSAYHFGDASLQGTITAMAQNYVGTNNINLLSPEGQFGSRLMGGKDAASPRYIFTHLSPITRHVFHPDDDPVLDYLDDDGMSIEPHFYVPVLPMVLVNGTNGIGTGFSTQVPQYDPVAIVKNVRRMIAGEDPQPLTPYYKGFTGSISANGPSSWTTMGTWKQTDADTIEITELPIGRWTNDYKEFLEGLMETDADKTATRAEQTTSVTKKGRPSEKKTTRSSTGVRSYENHSTEQTVRFVVRFATGRLQKLVSSNRLETVMSLTSSLSDRNMHLYTAAGRIKKFETVSAIQREFFEVRHSLYGRRKTLRLEVLQKEIDKLGNRIRFVEAIMAGTLDVFRKTKREIEGLLDVAGYARMSSKGVELSAGTPDSDGDASDFSYLISMQISTFTKEKLDELNRAHNDKRAAHAALEGTSVESLWNKDLDALVAEHARQAGTVS